MCPAPEPAGKLPVHVRKPPLPAAPANECVCSRDGDGSPGDKAFRRTQKEATSSTRFACRPDALAVPTHPTGVLV